MHANFTMLMDENYLLIFGVDGFVCVKEKRTKNIKLGESHKNIITKLITVSNHHIAFTTYTIKQRQHKATKVNDYQK